MDGRLVHVQWCVYSVIISFISKQIKGLELYSVVAFALLPELQRVATASEASHHYAGKKSKRPIRETTKTSGFSQSTVNSVISGKFLKSKNSPVNSGLWGKNCDG